MLDLVSIDVSVYYEIKDEAGEIIYTKQTWRDVRKLENLTEEFLLDNLENHAKSLNISKNNIRMISKKEYEEEEE